LKGPLKFIIAILDSDNEDNDTVLSDYLDKFKTAEMNSYKDINLIIIGVNLDKNTSGKY